MEKQGMDGRRRLFGNGLVIMQNANKHILLTLFLLITSGIFAQNTGIGSAVTVTISPEVLTVGSPFTLTLLVDYPAPEEVSVIMPQLSRSLFLDRYIRVPRVSGTGRTQTSFEFRLISNTSGSITIGQLSVVTPLGTTETESIVLNISGETAEQRILTLQFRWEGAPRQITTGERITFLLRDTDAHAQNSYPQPAFFMPQVPRGVILSQSPVSAQESQSGVVFKLTLIPLEAGDFNLPAQILQHENVRFEIPPLHIRVIERTR
jgi:hypothetical protein